VNVALPVKREPGVVEAEAEEGQQEVQLLVDLGLRVSDVRLKIKAHLRKRLSAFFSQSIWKYIRLCVYM
jgi:hypothetical protein